jgi:transcriptional regulator with PAS, ATPase and Fis domain
MAERTLTALLSSFAGERAEMAVLLAGGRADGVGEGGLRAVFVGDELTIGRGAAEEQVGPDQLTLGDPLVSGKHAHIARAGAGYQIADLGSKNGTFVEANRIAAAPVPLEEGARVFIGNHLFVFRQVSAVDAEALDEERREPLGPVATRSPALARLCHKLRRLAGVATELLLAGETGVGKEVYARAVHAASGRTGAFVAINCAALPRELIESELYGYRPGAHSTAQAAKPGLIEEAEGGTLFLDEIAEMPAEAQAKLLRFLQDKEITPLGATRPRRVGVRIIAATNRPVAAGGGGEAGLRDDLLARLGGAPLRLPPLRERLEDLGALIAHFAAGAPPPFELAAFRALALYRWPLNVRELEKVLVAAWALAHGRHVATRDLSEALSAPAPTGAPAVAPPPPRRKSPEAAPTPEELETLLARHAGDVAEVARALGRQRAAVWRWIKEFGLKPEKYRP